LLSGGCNPHEINTLRNSSSKNGIEVRHLDRLHAKVYRTTKAVIVGSANASTNGLAEDRIGTIEAAILTDDAATLEETKTWFERKWKLSIPITDQLLEKAYELWTPGPYSVAGLIFGTKPRISALAADVVDLVIKCFLARRWSDATIRIGPTAKATRPDRSPSSFCSTNFCSWFIPRGQLLLSRTPSTVTTGRWHVDALFQLVLCCLKYVIGRLLDAGEVVARVLGGDDQFVELQLERQRISVLRCLNEKHHQKGDDGGAGVDHQLPGIAVIENRASYRPYDHDRNCRKECYGSARNARSSKREPAEPASAGLGRGGRFGNRQI
jgi:hypothetical protein